MFKSCNNQATNNQTTAPRKELIKQKVREGANQVQKKASRVSDYSTAVTLGCIAVWMMSEGIKTILK